MALGTTNITTTLVGNTIGVASRDVGTLCSSSLINKWSKYKPIIYKTTGVGITKNNIIEAKAGLSPSAQLTTLKSAITPNGIENPVDKTVAQVVSQINPYTYNPPTGGANSPYRIGDFRNYDHATTPPDSGAQNLKVYLNDFDKFVSTGQTSKSNPDNIYNWEITSPDLYTFGNVGIKMGEGTNEHVGFIGSPNAIPLPWIFANANNCRLGVAIRLKSTSNPLTSNKWIIFVGKKTLNSENEIASMLPSISTNIRMYKELINQCTSKGNMFDMVPILVENVMLSFIALEGSNGNTLQSTLTVTSSTNIYAFPSGAKNVVFNVIKDTPLPSIPGAELTYGQNGWYLATIFTGNYVQVGGSGTSNKYPVNNWAIIRPSASTKTETVTVTLRIGVISYDTGSPTMRYTDIHAQSYLIEAGQTDSANGYTFYGTMISGGPALNIYGYQGIADNYEIIIS